MTTVASLITDLKIATARTDDAAVALMLRGINAGLVAATLLTRPSSMRLSGTVTAVSNAKLVTLTGLTNWALIEEVYNSTGGCRVWPLQFNELDVLPLATSGYVQFYAIFGNYIHYRPQPSTNEDLTAYYLAYPTRVTSGDNLPFDESQDLVFSFAQAFVWAGFEESDSQQMWQKVSDMTGVPFVQITQIRDVLMRQSPNVYDVQNAVPKGAAQA